MQCEQSFIFMKYSREYILRSAFDVFMERGYDSTSISVLQQELKMSRGAMYRYFKNKEELFISVIDVYFFRIFEKTLDIADKDLTIKELIEAIHRRQRLVMAIMVKANLNRAVFLNYTALMIQAAKHYPGFIERFEKKETRLQQALRNALVKSIKIKEIRTDVNIDILCILFSNTAVREASSTECDESRFKFNIIKDIDRRKEVMDYLFSLIKT